jgi:hypothetical protein
MKPPPWVGADYPMVHGGTPNHGFTMEATTLQVGGAVMVNRNPYALDEPTWEAVWETRLDAAEHPDPRGTSVERLLQAIEAHAAAEQDALAMYARIGQESGDAIIALVMQMILDDEQRHHALLGRMATSLRNALEWRHDPGALPNGSESNPPVHTELLATTRELIREEQDGARYLRELGARERAINAGLDTLLLEMMALDSEKHAHLLRFVEDRLRAAARREDGPGD